MPGLLQHHDGLFSHAQTTVLCGSCSMMSPADGRQSQTDGGRSFRKKHRGRVPLPRGDGVRRRRGVLREACDVAWYRPRHARLEPGYLAAEPTLLRVTPPPYAPRPHATARYGVCAARCRRGPRRVSRVAIFWSLRFWCSATSFSMAAPSCAKL